MRFHLIDDTCYTSKVSSSFSNEIKTEKFSVINEFEIVKKIGHTIQKKDELINDENEDEEVENNTKSIWPSHNFILANANTFLSITKSNCVKIRLPFCKHFSYTSSFKYILQRVLRI